MRSGLCALVVVFAVAGACRGKPQLSFDIGLPESVVPDVAWFEVGAFRGADCSAVLPMLRGGIPDGSTRRVAFPRSAQVTPALGDLPRASYAFAAVAKNAACGVLATGCVEVDVGEADSIFVPLSATDGPTGECGVGASCQAARCVPANNNADPSVGAGCSLELLGSGPLANPTGGGGTLVSAPAIGATPTGFVIVYREVDSSGGTGRLTLLPVDFAGGALSPLRQTLAGRCGDITETDGVGLLVRGERGLISSARAPCGDRPALELLGFNATTLELGKYQVTPEIDTNRVFLSPSKSAAARASGHVVVFTDGDITRAKTMDPDAADGGGITEPSGTFGGTSGMRGAWVATSDAVLALLAAGTGDLVDPVPDAGVDGGTTPIDAGSDPTLRLLILPVDTPLTALNAALDQPSRPIVFSGEWGSVAANGSRVIVLSEGGAPGETVSYRAYDLNRPEPADQKGVSVEGQAKATAGDVAIFGDRAYFAILKEGSITLAVYANASTTLTPLRQLSLAKEPRISGISTVRDGRVAIAATETRVALTWTTAAKLTNNDNSGGYAVFACTR